MKTVAVVFFVSFLCCCAAFPVQLEDNADSIVGIPIFIEKQNHLVNKREDPLPVAYVLLQKPDEAPGALALHKRSVKDDEQDLETAAGTYALRPLFVYRQQLAYRQRRRNQF